MKITFECEQTKDAKGNYDYSKLDDAFLVSQYEQCYRSWIAHNDSIWQIPTIAGAVSGGLVLGAYNYAKNVIVLDGTLAIAWILMFILLVALIKHRFFSDAEQATLTKIEDTLNAKRIQRTTYIQTLTEEKIEYWVTKVPQNWVQRRRAYDYLRSGMVVFLVFISALIILSPFFF